MYQYAIMINNLIGNERFLLLLLTEKKCFEERIHGSAVNGGYGDSLNFHTNTHTHVHI